MYAGFHVKCLSFVSFNLNGIYRQILVQIPKREAMFFNCFYDQIDISYEFIFIFFIFIVAPCMLIVLSPLFVQPMHTNYYKIFK